MRELEKRLHNVFQVATPFPPSQSMTERHSSAIVLVSGLVIYNKTDY